MCCVGTFGNARKTHVLHRNLWKTKENNGFEFEPMEIVRKQTGFAWEPIENVKTFECCVETD